MDQGLAPSVYTLSSLVKRLGQGKKSRNNRSSLLFSLVDSCLRVGFGLGLRGFRVWGVGPWGFRVQGVVCVWDHQKASSLKGDRPERR